MKALIFVLLFLGQQVSAQTNMIQLSLDQYLALAKENSPKLKASKMSIQESVDDYKIAVLNRIPGITASTSYGFNWGTNFNIVTNQRNIVSSQNSQLGGQIQVPIYINGQNRIAVKKAKNQVVIINNQYLDDQFNYTSDLINLYYKKNYFEEIITITKQLINNSEEQYHDSNEKFKLGAISKDELILSNSALLEDKSRLIDFYGNLKYVDQQLRESLNMNGSPDSLSFIQDTDLVKIAPDSIGLKETFEVFANKNYKTLIQEQQIENSKLDFQLSREKVYPQLIITGGSATRYDQRSVGLFGPIYTQFQNNLGYYINIGLSFSLSTIIQSKQSNLKYRLEINRQIEVEKDLKRTLKLDIENIFNDLITLYQKQRSLASIFSNYQTVYNMSVQKLKYEKISQIDFLQIKSKYYESLSNYVSAKYDYLLKYRIYQQYLVFKNS